MRVMYRTPIFPSILSLRLLTFLQTTNQNNDHAKQRAERNARYLSEPKINETESWLEITANDPRPFDSVLDSLVRQHRWHINYEDPRYDKADVLDDTAPSWLREHPDGPRAYSIAGSAFYFKIPVDGYFPEDLTQIIPAMVEAYNRSGNPGRFALRTPPNHEWFDVVPIAAADGPQKPILDTIMSFESSASTRADLSLTEFCEELSRRSGQSVLFFGFGGIASNLLAQSRIELKSKNQLPAKFSVRCLSK